MASSDDETLNHLQIYLKQKTERIRSARIVARAIVDGRKAEAMAGTAKLQGAPSRIDQILQKAEQALDGAFARLEKATDGTLDNAKAVDSVAQQVEKSNRVMADKLNQMTNGGPPLEGETDSSTSSSGQDGNAG